MSKLDPRQTLITLPDEIPWQVPDGAPPGSVAEAVLAGAEQQEGSYLVLAKSVAPSAESPATLAPLAATSGIRLSLHLTKAPSHVGDMSRRLVAEREIFSA